ncbi:hypothetical protein GQ53DRAFT_765867 [Thozetella sp. PMI_491]|nr:hypothetical protein GQ53DRAFT_765867 [Thozetella sp. PMI_491]
MFKGLRSIISAPRFTGPYQVHIAGVPMQNPTAKAGETHSEEEWERMRDVFVLLYRTQGWSLPRVRETLAQKFGFHATWGETKTNNFFEIATTVPALASASEWAPAQALYAQMLDHAGPLVQDRNPIIAVCMLQICVRFYQDGQHAVLDRFLSFIMALVAARGLHTHPLRLMASAWRKSSNHAMDLVTLGAQQAYDILKKQLGPEHPQTLAATRALHGAHFGSGNYVEALKIISETAEIESKLGFGDLMLLDAKFRVLRTLIPLNRLDEATAGIEAIEATTRRLADQIQPVQREIVTEKIQVTRAELLRHQLDPKAEDILSEIVERYKRLTDDSSIGSMQKKPRCFHTENYQN